MGNFVHFNSVLRVNLTNFNSSEGAGNQITLKKITTFNGAEFVYVSGQAYRRYIRESIYWMSDGKFNLCGIDKDGSPIIKIKLPSGEEVEVVKSKKIQQEELKKLGLEKFENYESFMHFLIQQEPELDIFGFLLPISEKKIGHTRKASPFQVTPWISAFPYNYNSDMMTRSKAEEQAGDIVKVEFDAFNYMQGAQIINVDLIGGYWNEHKEMLIKVLTNSNGSVSNEKKKRLNWLITALQNPAGGSKKARLLNDFSPILTVGSNQQTGVVYFNHSFEILPPDGEVKSLADIRGYLKLDKFFHDFNSAKNYIRKLYIGINPYEFANGEDTVEELVRFAKNNSDKVEMCETPSEVFEKLKVN